MKCCGGIHHKILRSSPQGTLISLLAKVAMQMSFESTMSVEQCIAYVADTLARHIQEILKRFAIPEQVGAANLVGHNSPCITFLTNLNLQGKHRSV